MKDLDIAVIINSFNRLELLKQCLGVLASWLPGSEIDGRVVAIIYDAGSTDGSLEWLAGDAKKLGIPLEVIIPTPGDDTSFSAGINTGVNYAERKLPLLKYLLFYETDNQILEPKPLLQALAQLENRPRIGACGFTVRQCNGDPAGVGMPFPRVLNFALGKNIVHKFQLEAVNHKWETDSSGVQFSEVDSVFTSPLLIKIEAWRESGGLDAVMFPFSDCDVDWARRMHDAGWRMGVIPSNSVIHDNMNAISTWSKSRAMQFHRGRFRYHKRYDPIAIYTVWPLLLLIRHSLELITAKVAIKDPERRKHLSNQFTKLLKSCIRQYEE